MPASKDNFPSASHALTASTPMPQGLTRRSLLGTTSCVLPGRSVGSDVVVGAGALVTRDVADGTTVVGIPARPLGSARSVDEDLGAT